MNEENVRQLKAIMFTDIKGFSSMMGKDEELTVRLVREHRDLVRELLAKHHGTERQTIGDAFMVLFDSAVNAVRCAVEIQTRLREMNGTRPEAERVWLRIGIHLGDIIVDEKEIYGDGVNIAARVEPQAEPGGICITQQVFHQIEGKLACRVIHLGQRELKNIRNAPELYNIVLDQVGEMDGPATLGAGRVQVVDKDAVWPKQPWWKHLVWWLVVVPIPAALFYIPVRDLRSGTGFVGGSSSIIAALNLLIPVALLAAAFFVSRFWSRGSFNPWLQGRYFAVFPAVCLLLFLYHYVVLQGRIESAIVPVSSCSDITSALSAQITGRLYEAIESYAVSFALDNSIISYLALIVLLGYVFVPRGFARPVFSRRYWLVLAVGFAIMVVVQIVFADQIMMAGALYYLMLVAWFLTAAGILRSAREDGRPFSAGARALGAGALLTAALSSILSIAGFMAIRGAMARYTPDIRPLLWNMGMNEISIGHGCSRAVVAVLFALLVILLRKGLVWDRTERRSAMAADLASMGITFVLALLPLATFPQATREMHRAMSLPVGGMKPAALKTGAEASFYVDRAPAAVGIFSKRIFMEISGKELDSDMKDEALLGALAGGKQCKALVEASQGDPAKKALGPALCFTAIEARIACEVQGKRLATPEEWDAAVGGLKPLEPAAEPDPASPITRLPIGEWTMRVVHGNPVFELKGAEASPKIPKSLAPTAFSPEVGFRCAYTLDNGSP